MAKTDPMPVRFTESQAAALKHIARMCNVTTQDVARWAVEALNDYWRHHQERLLLPLRFQETFSVTVLDPTKPLVLHELPVVTVRQELVRPEDSGRKNKPAQKAAARD